MATIKKTKKKLRHITSLMPVYNWKVGETLIVDRTHIHCASSRINNKKLGLTTFTKK